MRLIACIVTFAFCALIAPDIVFAKKKATIGRPASKPPVYKKFDNRKKKSTFKWGSVTR